MIVNRLYPPQIENKIPATYAVGKSVSIAIPVKVNPMTSLDSIKSCALKVTFATGSGSPFDGPILNGTLDDSMVAHFDVTMEEDKSFQVGAYYRLQLAFVDNEDKIGYYSNVGIMKFTACPNVTIQGRETNLLHQYTYTGIYKNEDVNEKVYSYCFNIFDQNNNLVETSGELIHSIDIEEASRSSADSWTATKILDKNMTYKIQYVVTTFNGAIAESPLYELLPWSAGGIELGCVLHSILNLEEGCIELFLSGDAGEGIRGGLLTGTYIISRSDSTDNFSTMKEIGLIQMLSSYIAEKTILFRDYTIESGVRYKYWIQAENKNKLRTEAISAVEEVVMAHYENMYLYDGKRQLTIRYNPKMSSFKFNKLESKMDTIGGQYPIFFRNGYTHYAEFPISGLISVLMDENNSFTSNYKFDPDGILEYSCTDLTIDNIWREKQFKMEVLEWLNNGQPKLFRSPTEGIFIVRLMNISLTPQDALGRMLHTFSCTAYQIADNSFDNYISYGFLHREVELESYLQFSSFDMNTFKMSGSTYKGKRYKRKDFSPPIRYLEIWHNNYNNPPLIRVHFAGDEQAKIFSLGKTGHFTFDTEVLAKKGIYAIGILEGEEYITGGVIGTYSNYVAMGKNFDYIESINTTKRFYQLLGTNQNIVKKVYKTTKTRQVWDEEEEKWKEDTLIYYSYNLNPANQKEADSESALSFDYIYNRQIKNNENLPGAYVFVLYSYINGKWTTGNDNNNSYTGLFAIKEYDSEGKITSRYFEENIIEAPIPLSGDICNPIEGSKRSLVVKDSEYVDYIYYLSIKPRDSIDLYISSDSWTEDTPMYLDKACETSADEYTKKEQNYLYFCPVYYAATLHDEQLIGYYDCYYHTFLNKDWVEANNVYACIVRYTSNNELEIVNNVIDLKGLEHEPINRTASTYKTQGSWSLTGLDNIESFCAGPGVEILVYGLITEIIYSKQ